MENGFEDRQSGRSFFEIKHCTAETRKFIGKTAAFDADDAEKEDRRGGEGEEKGSEEDEESMCGTSGKTFSSLQQLNSQGSLVHDWRHPGVELAKCGSSVDQRCRKQCWTPLELGAHFIKFGEGLKHEGQCQPCEVCTAIDARDEIESFSQDPPMCWHVW